MSDDNRSDPILTETHVIIIACVCGVIIVTLLIILFCFIFRRRKNAAKNYESGTPAGDPPPYTSVNSGPHKKPHQNSSGGAIVANSGGYDNQGMDTSDLQLNELTIPPPSSPHIQQQQNRLSKHYDNNNQHHLQVHQQHRSPWRSSPTPPPPYPPGASSSSLATVHVSSTSPHGFTNSSYGPLELQHHPPAEDATAMLYLGRHQGQQPHSQHSPRRLAEEEKHLYENQLNQWSENNRMENYPNRDAQSPNKDKYIDLHDRGGGGDMLDYGAGDPNGQPGAGAGGVSSGKPKKVIYEVVV